jgi:hypothetical protein
LILNHFAELRKFLVPVVATDCTIIRQNCGAINALLGRARGLQCIGA